MNCYLGCLLMEGFVLASEERFAKVSLVREERFLNPLKNILKQEMRSLDDFVLNYYD